MPLRRRAAAQLPPPGASPDTWDPSTAPPPPIAATTRPLDLFYQRVSAALRAAGVVSTASRRHWPRRVLRDTVGGLSAEVPRDLLQVGEASIHTIHHNYSRLNSRLF